MKRAVSEMGEKGVHFSPHKNVSVADDKKESCWLEGARTEPGQQSEMILRERRSESRAGSMRKRRMKDRV